MALLRINNTSLPGKPGFSALYPKYPLCSLVLVILHTDCDFGIFLAVCVSSDRNLLCILGTLLSRFSAPLLCSYGTARSCTTALCSKRRSRVLLKTATSAHGKKLFIYHLTFVCRNVSFGVVIFVFSCAGAVGRVVNVTGLHCSAPAWKNRKAFFSLRWEMAFWLGVNLWCEQCARLGQGVRAHAVFPHLHPRCAFYRWHLGVSVGCCSRLNCSMLSWRLGCHFYNCLGVLLPLFITFDIQNEPHAFIEQ